MIHSCIYIYILIHSLRLQETLTTILMETPPHLSSFEPGSYAFLCVPSIDNTWHPFSIASRPGAPQTVFHIKSMGGVTWTKKLLNLARECATPLRPLDSPKLDSPKKTGEEDAVAVHHLNPAHGIYRVTAPAANAANAVVPLGMVNVSDVKMYVYGPFGALNVNLSRCVNVVLVAGGIGITPMMSIFLDLGEANESGGVGKSVASPKYPYLKKVTLLWITRENFHLIEPLQSVTSKKSEFSAVIIRNDGNASKRKTIGQLFTAHGLHNSETAVLACGPEGLIRDTEQLSYKNGYSFHKEVFMF